MKHKRSLHPAWWALILVGTLVGSLPVIFTAYNRDFTSYARVTLTSDRAGLVMDTNSVVKFRGVQVGRVASVQPKHGARLQLELYPDQLKYIPANVEAQITAPTAFGAKYVDLIAPRDPSHKRLASGAVLRSRNVSIEVNTVFQTLVGLLDQIDPAKINAVLSALAEGFRGKGQAIGEAITDFNQVLLAVNPRSELIRTDWRAFKGFSDTYSAAAQNLLAVLDAGSTVSSAITDNAHALDSALLNLVGLSNSGVNLIGPSKDNLIAGINVLEPTTRLLMKYNPEYTCMLLGAKLLIDNGYGDAFAYNGRSFIADAGLLFGDDAYRYPDNLPVIGGKGGYGGAPSCGSLPDVSKNWPVKYVITDSGYGGGVDIRPNPGIGFPGWALYSPVTRGTPLPPTLKDQGPAAPGPVPYPGAPPYGAKRYTPDGKPLYPGLPPAPPPGRPRDPGLGKPPAGSEPFVPAYPGTQPTPLPPAPPPPGSPSP